MSAEPKQITAAEVVDLLLGSEAEEMEKERKSEVEFRQRVRERWKDGLLICRALLRAAMELGSSINSSERSRAVADQDAKFEALVRNHARVCRIGKEALCLAENGYASAALARWRTMHEIAVVCLFLRQGSLELSRRYLLYDAIDSYKSAAAHEKYAERFQCIRPTTDELAAVEAARTALQQKYGMEYLQSYGWAHGFVKGKPTFEAIQEAVSFDHWFPRYKLASQECHAEAKATYWSLSSGRQDKFLLVGQSAEGLTEALHPVMLSASIVSSCLVVEWPSEERIFHLELLKELEARGGAALLSSSAESDLAPLSATSTEPSVSPDRGTRDGT